MENQQSGQTKNCPKCGELIQVSAKKCKHCQADLRNWFARHKILTVILALILIGIIGSAGGSKTEKVAKKDEGARVENTDVKETKSEVPIPAKEEIKMYKVGDSVKLGGAIVTVNKIEASMGGQFSKPQEGNAWINLNITIENTEDRDQYITTMGQMFLRDGDGNSYQAAVTDKSMESVNNNLDGTILAKSKRTGWVGFEVKKDVKQLGFQYNGSMWGGGSILVDLGGK